MTDTPLGSEQRERLAALLRNESDVAYRRRVRRVLEYLDLRPGHRVLDCGTGMGFYLKVISELYPGCELVGIDYEPRVLGFAREHLPRRASLVRGDVHRLPFASGTFDRAILSEVLEHLRDDGVGLDEVRRVMKPGAVVAITVPNKHYPYWYDPINRLAEGVLGRAVRRGPFAGIWANHERLYSSDELAERVAASGLEVEVVEELTHYCFPATQTLVYTIGKPLIEHNLLPGFVARSTHRFQGERNRGSRLNPINWMHAVLDRFDRPNEDPARVAGKRTFVNVAIKARKV